MIANTEREFYRVDEVAKILGVDESEIIRLVIDGKLRLSAEVVGLLHYEYSSPCDDAPPYDDKEHINGKWFKFSETLRATSNQLLDIVQSYCLDEALKVLWSKAGKREFSSLEGDVFKMILALEDGSYIRPIVHDGTEWSHFLNIPNDVILGVKRENLDALRAKQSKPATPAPEVIKGEGGNNLESKIHSLAIEYIQRQKANDLHPSQQDVANKLEELMRGQKIYGVHNRPMSASYIKRNFLQGDWWRENNRKK